jgi:hypothetical protein
MDRVGLFRFPSTDDGTFGVLVCQDGVLCNTIELPWRGNKQNVSCIPCGEYECEIVHSPSRGRVYHVKDVPGRTHILIHVANFGGDTEKGKRTDLQGCIGPGMRTGILNNQNVVLASMVALNKFHNKMGFKPFTLVVKDI